MRDKSFSSHLPRPSEYIQHFVGVPCNDFITEQEYIKMSSRTMSDVIYREFTFRSVNLNENYIYHLFIKFCTLLLLTLSVFIIESIMKIDRLTNNRVSYF